MATYTVSTTDELQQRTANAGAGDEIIARGGTYSMNSRWTVTSGGSDGNPLVIRAANGEVPKIDFNTGGSDSGVQFRSPYVNFIGFEVANSSWKGVNTDGNAHDVVFERLNVHDSRIWGIMNNGCDNVVFRNCDSHHNTGNNENADGFNMTGPATNGLIEGCRAWANGDDGYDFWVSENHLIRDCWAWDNGRGSDGDGNGFKLGGGPNMGGGHRVERCVAYNNRNRGFDWNTTDNSLEVVNCTAVDNSPNFRFSESGPYTLRNNIAVGGVGSIAGGVDDQNNSWNLGMDGLSFKSRDPGSDDFLQLPSDSPAIDAGVDTGVDYSGDAPDLGAFEYADTTTTASTEDTSTSSRTTLDAETTMLAQDAETTNVLLESQHSGYNGDNYANFASDSGADAVLAFPVEVPEAVTYDYTIRYANGGDGDRTANLTFAGQRKQVTFEQTGAWDSWTTMSGTVDLPSGAVDLAIETTGQDAGNVDQITLAPVPQEDTSTSTDSTGDTTNHGLRTPEEGASDWHVPLNENFETIDQGIPIVDSDGARENYTPVESALFIAVNTGTVYFGDGNQWNELGSFN